KPLRGESRVISGGLVVTTVCYYRCTRAAGAPGTRLSLLPLFFEGQTFANLGQIVPRECGRMSGAKRSAVMSRFKRGIQYAAASRFYHGCLWNTGSRGPGYAKASPRLSPCWPAEALAKAASLATTSREWAV